MQILQTIKIGDHNFELNHQTKHIIKTLVTKGYLTRNPNTRLKSTHYELTEKGAKILKEYDKVKKILEKTREGNHPSTDHRDR